MILSPVRSVGIYSVSCQFSYIKNVTIIHTNEIIMNGKKYFSWTTDIISSSFTSSEAYTTTHDPFYRVRLFLHDKHLLLPGP